MSEPAGSGTRDSEIVARCLGGDERAWQELVNRYARLVYATPVRYGLPSVEVEEIAQEVFVILAENLDRIEDPERLPGWLLTTTRRVTWRALQQRARSRPQESADVSDGEPAPGAALLVAHVPSMAELLEGWARQEALGAGLARLGPRCRELMRVMFLDPAEPSYDEISQQLGIPKGSLGPTRNRCLEQLRAILEGLGFGR